MIWRIGLVIYRLFLHPLSKYPGPKLYAASHLPYTYKICISGQLPRETIALHAKYGPIVRISPNCLAVDGSIGFPQIFQHRPGKPEWSKQRGFYHEGDEMSLIGGTHEAHRRLRRQLNHAFSDGSMYEQEPVVKQYVDLLCTRLGERAATGESFDLVRWFNFMTFDVIGDLMFADSFHSLDGGNYHPWVLGVFEGVRGAARKRALLQYPFLGPILHKFGNSAKYIAKDAENRRLAEEKAMLRKAQGETPGGRRDFMTYMLKKNRDGEPGFSDMEILMNSPLLVTAGSETTSTALSSLFFHLGLPQNRAVYETLTKEIRTAFNSEDEIDMKTTARLPYLHGAIEEVLRVYPPAAETPPRISPGADLNGEFIPKGVSLVFHIVLGWIRVLIPYYDRRSCRYSKSQPTTTRPTLQTPTRSGRSGGCRRRTRCTIPCSPTTTKRVSVRSRMERETVWARTWRTRRCAWLWLASCTGLTTSWCGARTTGWTGSRCLLCGRSQRCRWYSRREYREATRNGGLCSGSVLVVGVMAIERKKERTLP